MGLGPNHPELQPAMKPEFRFRRLRRTEARALARAGPADPARAAQQVRNDQTRAGQRRGQWPSSPEITAAMFERYGIKPNP